MAALKASGGKYLQHSGQGIAKLCVAAMCSSVVPLSIDHVDVISMATR